MSFIHYPMNQIYLKILYHGPTESGKTTNLQWIAKKKQADSLVFEKDFPFDLLTLPMEDFHTYQVACNYRHYLKNSLKKTLTCLF